MILTQIEKIKVDIRVFELLIEKEIKKLMEEYQIDFDDFEVKRFKNGADETVSIRIKLNFKI